MLSMQVHVCVCAVRGWYQGLVMARTSTRADSWCLKVSPTVGLLREVRDIVCRPSKPSSRTPSRSCSKQHKTPGCDTCTHVVMENTQALMENTQVLMENTQVLMENTHKTAQNWAQHNFTTQHLLVFCSRFSKHWFTNRLI